MAKKKRRKYKKWFIYTVLGLIVFVGLFILLKTVPIFVVMEGDKKITLEVHDVYNEPGAYNRFTKKNITPEGTVDTDTLGKYTLTYSSFLQKFKRTVIVVDTTAPQISLNGRDYVMIPVGQEYTDAGAVANDNYDGNITEAIKITNKLDTTKAGTYEITYTSTDSSKNTSTVTRTIAVVEDDFSYVGTVNNNAGINDSARNAIVSFFDSYYRSIRYLEAQDVTGLFHSEYRENAARLQKGLDLTVYRRQQALNNLVLDDCHYDLTFDNAYNDGGAFYVHVLEDGYYNFHFINGTESRQHNIETDVYLRYENGEYKISSLNHKEGAFIYVDDRFDYSSDYQKELDDIGNKYIELYDTNHAAYEADRQAVNSNTADTSGMRTAANPYNRENARAYALQYATTRNPEYPYYGSNCMNFVSQCMHAGGIPIDYTGSAQWKNYDGYYDDSDSQNGFSYAFIHIYYYQNYLNVIDDGMVVDQHLNLYLGEPGDFIYVDSSTDEYGDMAHVIEIVDVIKDENGNIIDFLVCGNTNDQYCYPLSAQASPYKLLAKVEGYN